jgi:Zn finger protein HypA/HybF involved in hydrogenase expression
MTLATKQFSRNIEDFICEHCEAEVEGNGYTNHCPKCLWSKHVDINPGDRQAECQGLMEPISVETKRGQYVILQKCQRCGFDRRNKTISEDNFETILNISSSRRMP